MKNIPDERMEDSPMKKSSFVTMILGTVSGVLFALGMVMALVPEFNAFTPGIVLGCVGLVFALITIFVWRKMTHKAPIHLNGKMILSILIGVVGALGLGVGMCLCMVWGQMIWGVVVGLIGIVALLCLIPMSKGIHD